MARCHRGHDSPRDRQRRCIECRRLYDRARIGTPERRASQIRYDRTLRGYITDGLWRARVRIQGKADRVRHLEQELLHG